MSRICVVGSWHLAAVMSACFADVGHKMQGVDDNVDAIDSLAQGSPTVFEPKLKSILTRNIKEGRLAFTTDFQQALKGVSIVFLAIDTPITAEGVNLTPIWNAARKIAASARQPYILVVTSQVPVGTCEMISNLANEANPQVQCDVVCNPEFLRLGTAIDLFRHPDRIILGAARIEPAKQVASIYKPFRRPVLFMSLREAEIVKHATNAYVANSVSFMGEISQLCDELGADAFQVSKALRLDRRIGKYAYVKPGLGFNGGTVARDVKVLLSLIANVNKEAPLLQAILDVNHRQNCLILERLKGIFGDVKGLEVGLLGLTYKAHTSTLRNSLTLQIAKQMHDAGMLLKAYDPIIVADTLDPAYKIRMCQNMLETVEGSDALVIMTDKDEFKQLKLSDLAKAMRNRVLVDAVNFFDPQKAVAAGFTYVAIGRGFKWLSAPFQN